MNKYQQIIGQIQYYVFLAVVALLPLPQIFLRYACVTWIVLWLLEGRWLSKPSFSSPAGPFRFYIPFLLFGAWYIWKIVSGLWVENIGSWSTQMERCMTFGMLIPVGIWGVNRQYDWRQVGKVLVISCLLALPLYLIIVTALYYHHDWMDTLQWAGWNNDITYWHTYFSENITVFKHRLYLCAVELLGAIVAYRLLEDKPVHRFGSIAIMLSAIPLTGSRQSILTAVALFVIAAIYALPKEQRKRWTAGIIVIGLTVGGGLLKLHPRMQQFDLNNIIHLTDVHYTHDIRFNIWGAGLQHPEDYLWTGVGAGQSRAYMQERYNEVGFPYYAEREFNCHNQYLEELIELGVFGLLLFLLAWLSIPLCARGQTRQTAWLFTALFMMNMFTECVFGRFDGIALWAVGMIILLLEQTSIPLEADTESAQQTARDTHTHRTTSV